MPGRQKTIVEQRYGKDGTLKELAEQMGLSVHKIYHALDDARDALADCVERNLKRRGFSIHGEGGR